MGAIDSFQARMKSAGGFARLARYEVIINPPENLLKEVGAEYVTGLSIMCDSITMPGKDLKTTPVKHGQGLTREQVTAHVYEGTITATFYLERNLEAKDFFELWQNQAVSNGSNHVNYYDDYASGSMEIHQLSSIPITETTYHIPQSEVEGSKYKDAPVDRFGHELPIAKTQKKTHETIRTYSMKVEEVYPATIGQIDYAYATVNEIARLSVEFQYRSWKEM
tara:strand:+ start:54 stop:719 length:666 start_codon:yes stop_codon:yes gene_type:complete